MTSSPIFCLLFVPGDRPERFEKALKTGADIVCIDLEAAVGEANRSSARLIVNEFLDSVDDEDLPRIVVRINKLAQTSTGGSGNTSDGQPNDGFEDLSSLLQAENLVHTVMTSHTEEQWQIQTVLDQTDGRASVIALIESVRGLQNAIPLAQMPGVRALMLGGVDLATQLRSVMSYDSLLFPRSQIVQAAANAGIDAIDTPALNLDEEEMVLAETHAVRQLGFTGKAVVHPKFVQDTRQCFRPTPQEVELATEIVAADLDSEGGVVKVRGRMVDAPVVKAMRRLLDIEAIFLQEEFDKNDDEAI